MSDDETPGRISAGPVRTWVLLDAERRTLVVLLLVAVYVALVAVVAAWPNPVRPILATYDPVPPLFQALATGVITAVTLVVTINQLVLSQELGAIGDQRGRMQESMQFRRDVEERTEPAVAPPTPAAFLQELVEASCAAAERLADEADQEVDAEFRDRIAEYTDTLVENADEVTDSLDDAQFGTFEVIKAALDYNYSYKIYQGRNLREEGRDVLDEDTIAALDDLVEVLQFFGPAREHFKTLYFQWELTNLSRGMIYTALPALVVAAGSLLLLGDPAQFPGTTLGIENVTFVLVGAVVLAIVPFLLLLSYMLRISVVAKRTLAMGPFVLRQADRIDDEGE